VGQAINKLKTQLLIITANYTKDNMGYAYGWKILNLLSDY